ncbi:MAG: alanine racemase [Acidobacteriota bacterium]|nr:alanine racemase [Acidobacteriota bacterium]
MNKDDSFQAGDQARDSSACRPTCAEIDLDALAWNFREVQRVAGERASVMCVVKADAYGHGARECALRLEREGADWFAVALPEEGIALREAGVSKPILCLEGFWQGQAALCVRERLTPIVYRLDTVEQFDCAAREAGMIADVHVKIDTGMNRLGVRAEDAAEFAARLHDFKNIRIGGLLTHFASADEIEAEEFTREQATRFVSAVETFRAAGHEPTVEHLSNSAATFARVAEGASMVRPGGALYGLWRDVLRPQSPPPALRSVMSWRTRITLLKRVPAGETLGYARTHTLTRDSLIATLPVGYADGFRRALSNRGRVLVRGRFAPVVGRVSMDLTIIDVTDVPGVAGDDPVTLIGADGDRAITAEEFACDAGTISYEITCGIGARVPRRFKSGV